MGLLDAIQLLTHDVAIDLGTSNTCIHVQGRGVLLDEPSMVAVRQEEGRREVVAVGAEAKQMLGRTPGSITAVRPLREGTIQDYEVTEAMLRYFLQQSIGKKLLFKPRFAVCAATGASEVEKRAVLESARSAGGREVLLFPEAIAAAVGAEMPILEPQASVILDIGGGTTKVSVISMGGIVASRRLHVGGDSMDESLKEWIRVQHNVLIGDRTAELIKLEVGCARVPETPKQVSVKGRDLSSGIPRQLKVSWSDAQGALADCVTEIVEALRLTLQETPPELAADVLDTGVLLCGGGALLEGLCDVLRDASGLPVMLAADPRRCVVQGLAHILADPALIERFKV